jgi:hypothetical protein
MARPLENTLLPAAEVAFGSPSAPRAAPPTAAEKRALAEAWSLAPVRYRDGLFAYLAEALHRNPERLSVFLEAMPFVDWTAGRGVMPFWMELFTGIPSDLGKTAPRAVIPPPQQPAAWEAWWHARQHQRSQLETLCSHLDPFNQAPQMLSSQRARWVPAAFQDFITATAATPQYRDDVVSNVFIPLAQAQLALGATPQDNAMAGYLAGFLAKPWVADARTGHTAPWTDWMFKQGAVIWPNYSHRFAPGHDAPPHMYGLPERLLSFLLSPDLIKHGSHDLLPPAVVDRLNEGLRRALSVRGAPPTGSIWLPSARALRDRTKVGSLLRSYVDTLLLGLEGANVQAHGPGQARAPQPRRM